jgi:hypothetical protein
MLQQTRSAGLRPASSIPPPLPHAGHMCPGTGGRRAWARAGRDRPRYQERIAGILSWNGGTRVVRAPGVVDGDEFLGDSPPVQLVAYAHTAFWGSDTARDELNSA